MRKFIKYPHIVEGATDGWRPSLPPDKWYFGAEEYMKYGDLISENLSGHTVSKRQDLAEEPGGLIYEANQLGIDMWDLLGALEGMCYNGEAREIDDSTYYVI